jgi:hypothetical protein
MGRSEGRKQRFLRNMRSVLRSKKINPEVILNFLEIVDNLFG